jgi:hypothetical protein
MCEAVVVTYQKKAEQSELLKASLNNEAAIFGPVAQHCTCSPVQTFLQLLFAAPQPSYVCSSS